MNSKPRIFIAITLTAILAFVAVSVWAGPGRQGTVPIIPVRSEGKCGEGVVIELWTGTLTAEGTCTLDVTVSDDPGPTGDLPEGWENLFDFVNVVVTSGEATSFEVCVPLIPDWQDLQVGENLSWYVWADGEWIAMESSLEAGPPEQVCGSTTTAGVFALLGK